MMAQICIDFAFEVDVSASASPFNAETKPDESGRIPEQGERALKRILSRFEDNLLRLFPEAKHVNAFATPRISSLHGDKGSVLLDFPSLDMIAAQPLVSNNLPKIADMLAEGIVHIFNKGWNIAKVNVGKPDSRPTNLRNDIWDKYWLESLEYDPNNARIITISMTHPSFPQKANNWKSTKFPSLNSPGQAAAAMLISWGFQVAFFLLVLLYVSQGQNARQQELLEAINETVPSGSAPITDVKIEIEMPDSSLATTNIENAGEQKANTDTCNDSAAVRVFVGGIRIDC